MQSPACRARASSLQAGSIRSARASGAPLLPARSTARGSTASRRVVRARAGGDGGPSGDLDAAWSSFQKQLRSQVEVRDAPTSSGGPSAGPVRRPAPRRVISTAPGPNSWGGQEGERIRRAERVLVDIWSSEDFLKAGTIGAIALLVVFVAFIGPPPTDGRCTLFWC